LVLLDEASFSFTSFSFSSLGGEFDGVFVGEEERRFLAGGDKGRGSKEEEEE